MRPAHVAAGWLDVRHRGRLEILIGNGHHAQSAIRQRLILAVIGAAAGGPTRRCWRWALRLAANRLIDGAAGVLLLVADVRDGRRRLRCSERAAQILIENIIAVRR